jgi:hypothetical protein
MAERDDLLNEMRKVVAAKKELIEQASERGHWKSSDGRHMDILQDYFQNCSQLVSLIDMGIRK